MERVWRALMALGASSVLGCWESGRIDVYTCEDSCGNGQPDTSCDDPCGDCTGQCVPIPPWDFSGPGLLWMGPESEAPQCPTRAPVPVYEGHAALDASNQCPACECTEPACLFPSGLTASTEVCAVGGGAETPFNAPAGWGGACTSPGTITASQLASVTIQPLTERPCAPISPEVPQNLDKTWGIFARACMGEVFDGKCRDPGMTCEPTAEPPPPGFRQCVMYTREGDPECPATYPDKITFFGGLADTRECSPCECTQTVASDCVGLFSLYQGETCTTLLDSTMMGLGSSPACKDIAMPGAGLGSMEGTWVTNEPGQCVASGSVPQGEAKPLDPRTFCCQPPP